MTEGPATHETGTRGPTLDGLFRRIAVRTPDAPALTDPANRAWFTDGEPLDLTFAQADRIVWAIAARLHALGLRSRDVVAVQLPNTAESVLALLGILRAGMVVAPLPMLWRETEMVAALSGTGAKAIVTTGRIGESDHSHIAMKTAVQVFSVRHVCAFGPDVPDGVTPLDDVLTTRGFDMLAGGSRASDPASETAVITFETSARGVVAVPRNHLQVVAAGLNVTEAASRRPDSAILSATPLSSLAGLSATLLPWLLTGGRLVLHQPFDPAAFARAAQDCETVVLPASLLQDFAEHGLLHTTATVIALWRSPERAETASAIHGGPAIVDLRVFGETGLIASRRQADGCVMPLGSGPAGGALELKRSHAGTLALRGLMVAASGLPQGEYADTGYPCRLEGSRLTVSAARPGMIGIGGYGLPRSDLEALATVLQTAGLAALPDALLGQRLAASPGRNNVEQVLAERGVSPLIAEAFRTRRAA